MFKLLVLSCLLVSCLADPFVLPSWVSEVARRLGRGCADRAEGWRACASLEEPFVLAPHSRDCGAFFYCAWQGRPVCRRCPAGLYFNPQLQVCDWPSNVDCTSTTPYPTTADSSTTVTESSTRPEEYFTTETTSSTTLQEDTTTEAPSTTVLQEVSTTEEPSTTVFQELSTTEAPSTTVQYYWG